MIDPKTLPGSQMHSDAKAESIIINLAPPRQ
jgi:hypothetical protein